MRKSTRRASNDSRWPPAFTLFLGVLTCGAVLSVADALIRWPLQGAELAFSSLFMDYPLIDLTCYWEQFRALHTTAFFHAGWSQPWTYPAPCALLYAALLHVPDPDLSKVVYVAASLLALGVAMVLFGRNLEKAGLGRREATLFLLGAWLLSWPIYFSFQRGNIETLLWLATALALSWWIRDRPHLCAAGIGVVAAFKIYPVLFLALFLPQRRFRAVAEMLLWMTAVTVIGFRFLDRDILFAAHYTQRAIGTFLANYSSRYLPDANQFDHSPWALIKFFLQSQPILIQRLLPVYTAVAGSLATWFFFARVWGLPRFNQLLAVCTLTVLLPATSFDYTLQSLYVPFAWCCLLAVRAWRAGAPFPGLRAYFVLFGLLFSPLTFARGPVASVNGQFKAVLLVGLLGLAVRFPVEDHPPAQPEAERGHTGLGIASATPS